MASTSSILSRKIKYEVFLSFRGEDTRKTFVDHLYNKLKDTGVTTFKDDEKLHKGELIEKLLEIIKESQYAIVVFSKNYASSKWCLEEIATIMECQEQYGGRFMIPIFYHVDPTDVRNQTKSFAESFKRHEAENKDKVERWKEALKKAGQISGYHLQEGFNGYEGDCVNKVTNDIFTAVKSIDASTSLQNNFMGLGSRVRDVSNLLRQEINEVEFIGIWGMSGIGKTKIAKIVFQKFMMQFDRAYFFEDVRKQENTKLQEILLGGILNKKEIRNVAGEMKIKNYLKGIKVLIVLDNVDHVEQLEKLAGGRDWFGGGSRVIMTTRDRKVLVSNRVPEKCIYKVNELSDQEAIQVFCWYAFKTENPKTGFTNLCGSIVSRAMGLPLALKHLGKYLRGENVDRWEYILMKLKDVDSLDDPKHSIIKILKISFDELDSDNQNVFLHIACFFRNWRVEYVRDVLDNDMHVLINKSLISVQNGRIEMHNLIQEMGWHIASKENPMRRARKFKEVQNVLCKRMGHDLIEGICWWERLTFKITFKGMESLKMFKGGGGDNVCCVDENDNYFPISLRWLEYEFYHFPSLPQRFESSKLVGLSLRNSSLLNCNFTEKLFKLTILDLSSSSSLLNTPDFDRMPNLVRLNLSFCNQLKEIHPSIGNLRKLVFLNLRACSNLKKLPSFNRVSPEALDLDLCRKLENFPEIKAKTSPLAELDLREVGIIEVPSSIQRLHALTKLGLDDCKNLMCLPNDLCKLKDLKVLKIKNCINLKSLPENLDSLTSLEYLNLERSHFNYLPESFSKLTSLQYLDITDCQNPDKLPKLPANIRELYADHRFKIAKLAIECSELYSISYSYDDNHDVGTFLSEEFIHFQHHRETPLCVSYLIQTEDNVSKMNQMLRSFKYRHYWSNGISIHLNPPWYSQNFVGFVICFLRSRGDVWGPHAYQDIDHSMKHCTIIAKLSYKDGEEEVLQKNCVIAGLAGENDYTPHVCFAFIPFRNLCAKSKATMGYSRFEVQFMNSNASADWGCSLLYQTTQRQREAIEDISKHDGSDSGLTTDDIACLTLLELKRTEYLNLNRLKSAHLLDYSQVPHLRYIDISGCQKLKMLPQLPASIRELYAYSNLASESNIAKLALKYSELYSVSFSHEGNIAKLAIKSSKSYSGLFSRESNIAKLNLSAKNLARIFVSNLPSRNSPFLVTYPTLTDTDTKRWFKYQSHRSNKISINLNPSWYSQTFVGFVVYFLLKVRLHRWESHPNIRPFRHCKVIAKLIHKDDANEVLQTNCVISRLYDEEFDFKMDEFMICFAYIPFCSLSSVSPNDYSVFEVAFLDSNNSSDWSCGLLYKNDGSLSKAIWSSASFSNNDSEHRDEETSMTEAIIRRSIQSVHNHPIDEDCEIQQEPGPERIKSRELTEIVDPHQCRMVSTRTTTQSSDAKVVRLLYTNSGVDILALISSDGIQKLRKWSCNDEQYTSVKATANFISQHWQPNSGLVMNNDVSGLNLKKIVPCIDLFKDDSCVVSIVGMVSLFDINTFKALTTFWLPTPTFLVLHPHNNDIIAIGTEDATIYIYDISVDKVKFELIKGHHKHITGLAFSTTVTADNKYMLVSSSADAQLCVWDIAGTWQKRRSVRIQLPAGEVHSSDTHVMFHTDKLHLLLVTHETQLAIYDTSNMERKRQWIPHGCLSAPISSATYSCNCQLIYASFKDGNIGVFDAHSLRPRCRIAPSAYLSPPISKRSLGVGVYPLVIAAHPHKPYQIAVGLTDGSVKVIEPLESIGNWEVSPPINNGQPLAQPPATMCRQQTKLGDKTECILILMVFLCCFFAYKHIRINPDASYQGDEVHCTFMLAMFFCIFIGICFRFLVVFSGG